MNRSQFKELLELASLDNYFIFDGTIYKQIDGMAMGSPLGPTLAMALMCYMEEKWLSDCPRLRETRHLYGKLSNCKLQLYPKPTHPTTLTVNPYSEFSRFFYCMFYMQSFPGFTHMYYLFKFPHMYYSFPGFNQTVWYIFPDFPNL